MALEHKQKSQIKASSEQKISQYLEEKNSSVDEYEYEPNHSSGEQIPDDLSDEEDLSETGFRRNVEIEMSSDRINPEVGIIAKRKPIFAVLKVKNADEIRYQAVILSNVRLPDMSISEIDRIFNSFAHFEKITIDKLKYLASDERANEGRNFVLSKNISLKYSFLLPDYTMVPLSVLKGKKGKLSDETRYYRIFRSIIFEKRDRINRLKESNLSKFGVFDRDFVEEFMNFLTLDSIKKQTFLECLRKSTRAHETMKEYFSYLTKGGKK